MRKKPCRSLLPGTCYSSMALPLVLVMVLALAAADGFSIQPLRTTTTTSSSAAAVAVTRTQQQQQQQFTPSSSSSKRLLSTLLQLRGGGRRAGPAVVEPTTSSFSDHRSFHSRFLQKTVMFQSSDSSSSSSISKPNNPNGVPKFLYKLNSSTKWLVTLANTLGIWTRVPKYEGPFVVVGAIVAVYGTEVLKQIINQDRPNGAPFTDPGMPSSHSLVSFFMASAWTTSLLLPKNSVAAILIWLGATIVALLRVICGYHSWDQIGVGAILGVSTGWSWSTLGIWLASINPHATQLASWGFYLVGSALFIGKNMRDWIHKDKHL